MKNIEQLAAGLNSAYNTGNQRLCLALMLELYKEVQNSGGRVLLELDSSELQCVGLAFVCFALHFNNGDPDFNSVAAENAYYCLAKSYLLRSNTWVLPALFTLLHRHPEHLQDKFNSAVFDDHNFFRPSTQIEVHSAIPFTKYYLVSIFFDSKTKKIKMPDDINYFNPTILQINYVIEQIEKSGCKLEYAIEQGKEYFLKVFNKTEDALKEFVNYMNNR